MSMLHMLDTDTASYIIKGCPPEVEAKLATINPSMVCVSVITRAELMYGVKRLPTGHRLHIGARQFLKMFEFCLGMRKPLITTPIFGINS
ncbi:hypothetical protein [Mycoavidus sp. SF9855]|uniref:hypothetical protein n=1 Tax=Mycoavidus sp. SF9855 TaxID=2968475 RepID=UPI00211C6E4D|nr:hypothetical protein [Mycoavidus sp. SF9855]UUM21293.1 hypothetical protein NQD60_07590 [Mycoavidus sp. SF9855]